MIANLEAPLDIVIVNYNAGCQLFDCVRSILASPLDIQFVSSIVIVDNGSIDGSTEGLESLDERVRLIRTNHNIGFAAASNVGATVGKRPFLLFLNPDTRIFPGALSTPIRFMLSPEQKRVGICGIQLVDERDVVQRCCGRTPHTRNFVFQALGLSLVAPTLFPSVELENFDHASDRVVDHVIGAFYLVRRDLFHRLNGFDERFFVYLEDLDFSIRAREAGWRTQYLARVRAFHKGGGTSEKVKPQRLFYSLRSRIILSFKHFKIGGALLVLAATVFVEPFLRVARALGRLSLTEVRDTIVAYGMLLSVLPSILRTGVRSRSGY
jgi:GT2 family glycosyltransferase